MGYDFTGLMLFEVLPSPKFQIELAGAGVEVLEKLMAELMQTLSGAVKTVLMSWIFRTPAFLSVSEHPLLLVAARAMV